MATTDRQVMNALQLAAEELLQRSLTSKEADELVKRFNRSSGTYRERAREAIRSVTNLTEQQIREKTAASDNTDRIMTDMQSVLDDWKPGT